MKDVQSQFDERNVYLNEVGVKELVYPIEVRDADGNWISTPATISARVGLPAIQKGTHMSRFVEILQEHSQINPANMRELLEAMQVKLEAQAAFITMKYKYFVDKKSPVTERQSYLGVDVAIAASLIDDVFDFEFIIQTPVTTLCPCSKEISDYSAHNQRAMVTIQAKTTEFIPYEELVRISEESASSPLYTLLKRPDEKYVTEWAYDHPRFVEDVCREVKLRLDEYKSLKEYSVEVESFESIHNHNAFAKVVVKPE